VAANNNLNPEWQPQPDPNEAPLTWIWRKKATEYIYELRGMASNLNQTVQNVNSNLTQQITKIINAANNNAAANNNNANAKPPVIFGYSGIMWSNYPPNLWTGYFYVQTDRSALYYSNGSAWLALEGAGTGSFENRWANLNTHDSGLAWVETSRNNISGLPPYPYYQWDGLNWNFISGEFYRNQANLAVLAGTFASANSNNGNDVGARVNVQDFAGQLQWTNANNANGWAWGPDDSRMHGMGPILAEVDPSPVTGWQLYDGSNNVTYLQSTGSTGTVNLPNLSGNNAGNAAFLEAGQVDSGINPAVVPTFAGGNQNFNSANFAANNNGTSALTGPALITAAGTISNNGQPPSLVRRAWFRR
jgi:hypothetical protein